MSSSLMVGFSVLGCSYVVAKSARALERFEWAKDGGSDKSVQVLQGLQLGGHFGCIVLSISIMGKLLWATLMR